MKKWFSEKREVVRLFFVRLILKIYANAIPFLRKLKIYSIEEIKKQTEGVNSPGFPYADGLIMNIKQSTFVDGMVTVLFCRPNNGFIIKTVDTELLVAGLVDFGVPKAKTSSNPWRYILDVQPMWGGIQKVGTFKYTGDAPIPDDSVLGFGRMSHEERNQMLSDVHEEYKQKLTDAETKMKLS